MTCGNPATLELYRLLRNKPGPSRFDKEPNAPDNLKRHSAGFWGLSDHSIRTCQGAWLTNPQKSLGSGHGRVGMPCRTGGER
jgi:hypothetical protein